MVFLDRHEAGRNLAEVLELDRDEPVVIYGLPRGGVPVAAAVAHHHRLPLELIMAQKIGHPDDPELAVGAVTETGRPVWDEPAAVGLPVQWQRDAVEEARQEARRRREWYGGDGLLEPAPEHTAVVIDDGAATGFTLLAALHELRRRGVVHMEVGLPVAPRDLAQKLATFTDRLTVLFAPSGNFGAVGLYYRRFDQVGDDEVRDLIRQSQAFPYGG